MTKVRRIKRRINSLGGMNFVTSEVRKAKIEGLIEHHLGQRPKQAKYSYSDVLLNWILLNIAGGNVLEDTNRYRRQLEDTGAKVPSPDQIGRVMKSLSTKIDLVKLPSSINQINRNETLDKLLIDMACKLKVVLKGHDYTLDLDSTIIETEKRDAKHTYMGTSGYSPMVSMIDSIPIAIEGRNGNTAPVYNIRACLERTFDLLDKRQIRCTRIRIDSAGYQGDVIRYLNALGKEFFIRARRIGSVLSDLVQVARWIPAKLQNRNFEVADCTIVPFKGTQEYRIVITRIPRKGDPDEGTYSDENFTYRAIITNNKGMTPEEIVHFYDQRGASERSFDQLKNDFNWSRLPFSFLHQNMVFLLVSSMAFILFKFLLRIFSSKVDFVKMNFRRKRFITEFLSVLTEWITVAGERQLFVDSSKNYEVLRE